jgi:uncharacterized membrane protein
MARMQWIDLFALAWFFACWIGYAQFARHKSKTTASLVAAMRIYRREWFKRVVTHENRIADVAAFNSLLTGATFFASTAILILGGLFAMLGTTERVVDVVSTIPFARPEPELLSRLKIIVLIGVFVYTFFKFTWSIRQYHFCTVLVGAAPLATGEAREHDDYVTTLTRVASHAAEDFNQGLRAYYFALAAIAWFVHPWLAVASSALVVFILHLREFRSRTLHALTAPSSVTRSLQLSETALRALRADPRAA